MVFTLKIPLSPTVKREREVYVLTLKKTVRVYPVFVLLLLRVK